MNYFTQLGYTELGNLDKIYQYIDTLSRNISKLNKYPSNTEIYTNIDLDVGDSLICMRYGKDSMFYTVKGEYLSTLFDDWPSIQQWVESKVGNTLNKYPILSCGNDHIFRHIDVKRSASVNMGLYNSNDSTMCFWKDNDLVAHVRYNVGEAILASVKNEHSVIINDYLCNKKFRAILMWTTEKDYDNIV